MKRIIYYKLISVVIIMLSGCGRGSLPSINKKLDEVYDTYADIPKTTIREPYAPIELYDYTMSLDDAITYAVTYNPTLQAQLENLGVAQTDMHQAGLYSNPETDLAVRKSEKSPGHNVEFEMLTNISDLWQVPLRRHAAEYEYNAMYHSVIAHVLDTIRSAKTAYFDCLFAQEDTKIVHNMFEEAKELRDRIYLRYEHGYSNDLDLHFADTTVDSWEIELHKAQLLRDNAFIQLKNILGLPTQTKHKIRLTEPFAIDTVTIPEDHDTLLEQANMYRPEIRELEQRVNQYESQKRFEQANVFPHVAFGASFEQELSGEHLRGPALSLEIPLFDSNQAQISRAEFLKRRTQKELQSMRTGIDSEIATSYNHLQELRHSLAIYRDRTLNSIQQGLEYADYYTQQKRLTVPTLIQTRLTLYETHRKYLATIRDAWHTIAHLERATGTQLRHQLVTQQ